LASAASSQATNLARHIFAVTGVLHAMQDHCCCSLRSQACTVQCPATTGCAFQHNPCWHLIRSCPNAMQQLLMPWAQTSRQPE
jgi:hypothetical protein